ncbi:dGTP triphosphohydrolase [Cystobacter fuscus]
MLDWAKLLDTTRMSKLDTAMDASKEVADDFEHRTELERDYDRILFSTPVRRLADKTQVFPLERNDSVRTRLTHSYEVSNLARSMGTYLAHNYEPIKSIKDAARIVPPILAAVGLAHDLGNPPFGHQGENAIQRWFEKHRSGLFEVDNGADKSVAEDVTRLSEAMKLDFLRFEGNAQSLRLISRLQAVTNNRGLNLTFATLAALMKYPVASNQRNKTNPAAKKHGFFQSERDVVERVFSVTGLSEGVRHPLTWLMESCDDIAYSILDAEDAIKKGLVSASDLFAYLEASSPDDGHIKRLVKYGREKHADGRTLRLSPAELNDSTAQRFRVNVIATAVGAALKAFMAKYDAIIAGTLDSDLIAVSDASALIAHLKEFSRVHAYRHSSVLALELRGYNTIFRLMDMLWAGISERESFRTQAQSGPLRLRIMRMVVFRRTIVELLKNLRELLRTCQSDIGSLSFLRI